MRNQRSIVVGFVCLSFGILLASYFGTEATAQQVPEEAGMWEIYHGTYSQSDQDDSRFYVIRHNRLTGETQIVGCEDRNGCTQLKVDVQD